MIVDLNNFSVFPTLAIGLLVAAMRNAGHEVEVVCPLAYGVVAAERERRESWKDHLARRIHLSTLAPFRLGRDAARATRSWWLGHPDRRMLREVERALDRRPGVVLLSAYLQHDRTVAAIARRARERGIPVVLGGPMFNMPGVSEAWRDIPGLTTIVGGELDLEIPALVEAVATDTELLRFDGVLLPDGRRSTPAPPLRALDRVPVPDFSDFPWDRYPFRVVPLMAGRGCQWARCVFCSDVVSASGRTFRSRSAESVLHEMQEQARRHETTNFLFLDLKLNSNPGLLRAIVDGAQRHVPGAQWVGTVHVDQRDDNGLTKRELRRAAAAGMRRVSMGLESGSQRLLDLMDKGCSVERNSAFIRHAHEAGISVRCTMFKGFPGETTEDLLLTAAFLESHSPYIDRVRFNDFSIQEVTPVYREIVGDSGRHPQIEPLGAQARNGRLAYVNRETGTRSYRKAKARVLRAVHEINRREVRRSARAFDGLM